MVTGQYGTGKTETIKGLIRSSADSNPGIRIGAFVTESANIAPDAKRYGIDDDASGVSFASVCCPTVADMRQAINTALRNKSYDLLFLEPPGNMHPPLMAQVAVEKGIELEHVIMLVSERDFKDDKYAATFQTGLEIASIVGITHKLNPASTGCLDADMIRFIETANASAPIISFGKGELLYSEIQCHVKWSVDRMAGITEIGHSDHYRKVLRVFNPELPFEEIVHILSQIAETGTVSRGKGQIPKYNKQFDLKGKVLEISESKTPVNKNSLGYAVFFAKSELPLEWIDKVSMAPEQKTRQMLVNAPLESKFAVFGRLYKESQKKIADVISAGKVTHTYNPVDDAEKIATEIYSDTKDDTAIRMILPFYHGTRLNALKELSKRDPASNAFCGVHVSSVLINTSLRSDSEIDYTGVADQHHILKIKSEAIPALLCYSHYLKADAIKDFPRFESAVGPYILKAAQVGWANLNSTQRNDLSESKRLAKENMAKIHEEAGFALLAKTWEAWE